MDCAGDSDGEATVTATGGTSPYSYAWSTTPAQNNATATNLEAGQYSVTVTDDNGCQAVAIVEITEPTALALELISQENVSCNGGNDGEAAVNITGGVTPYTYLWSASAGGQVTATAINLPLGTHGVTVTDANGCTVTGSVLISEPSLLTSSTTLVSDVSCNGGSDGVANVTASGGTGPYSYIWSNGSTDEQLSGVPAGTYNVTVTDDNNCTSVSSVVISEPATGVSVSVTSVADPDCEGATTGSITASAAGGVGPYMYLWSDGQTGATASGLSAGTYVVTATDANGCTASVSQLLVDPTGIIATIVSSTNIQCNGESTGSATVEGSGGSGSYTYLWSNGQITATATGLSAGSYTVTVTEDGVSGCEAVAFVEITEPTDLISEIISSSDVSCFGAGDGTALVNATGGTTPYSYEWSDGQTTAMASNLAPGSYDVTVTDANGCEAVPVVVISGPLEGLDITSTPAVITDVSCNGGDDGSIDITTTGGTGPYSYAWSSGDNIEDPSTLSAGTYNVTVTDANGCTIVGGLYAVGEPMEVTASAVVDSQPDCEGEATGSATASGSGGTGSYEYLWSDGQVTATAAGLSAGTYLVTVTDANGCEAVASVLLSDPTGITATIVSSTNLSCFGDTDGSATVEGSGGSGSYTYEWSTSPVQTGPTATGLSAGQYTVTVTEDGVPGCEAVAYIEITEPAELNGELVSVTDESCDGAETGSATVSANGGVAPYSYVWPASAGSQTGPTASNLGEGTYQVTITDNNACEATLNVTVGSAGDLQIDPIADLSDLCPDSEVGSILLGSNLFNPDIEYSWTGGASVGLADGTSSGLNATIPSFTSSATFGSATVTVTASLNGCESTTTFDITIEDNEAPEFVNCPTSPVTIGADADCSNSVVWSIPVAEDNCEVVSVVETSAGGPYFGEDLTPGTYDIEYTATDGAGNTAVCNFTIIVEDDDEPYLVCQPDLTVSADGDCAWPSTESLTDPLFVRDNCPGDVLEYEVEFADASTATGTGVVPAGTVFQLGLNTVTYTLTDAAGNEVTCSFTVTVEDEEAPALNCPADIVASASITTCENEQTLTAPTVSDNCSAPGAISISYRVFNPDNSVTALIPGTSLTYTFQSGISTVEWVVEDEAGNSTTCSQQVTINEVLPTVGAGADEEICISALLTHFPERLQMRRVYYGQRVERAPLMMPPA